MTLTQDEYAEARRCYATLAQSGLSAFDFYAVLRHEGVSALLASVLLRDYYDMNLQESLAIKATHEGYATEKAPEASREDFLDRGPFCPKCQRHIPAFHVITPEVEREIRAIPSTLEQIARVRALTSCPLTWAKIWVAHPDGPHREFGETDAPPCPQCGKQLRTKLAMQCIECGASWHSTQEQ
jgi:hypothetical protein